MVSICKFCKKEFNRKNDKSDPKRFCSLPCYWESMKKFINCKRCRRKFLVDAYIPSLNLVIECDGDYWHSLDRVVKKDKAENAYLTKCGFGLLRLSETEIKNNSFKERMVF